MNRVIRVDHADDLGIRRRIGEREAQRAGLVALEVSTCRNLKRAPSAAQCSSIGCQKAGSGVLLMTTTHSKTRIVEPGDRIERAA